MADDEILRRLDARMERGNELMERNTEVIEEKRRAFQDLGRVLREFTLRHERVTRGVIEAIEVLVEEGRMHRAALGQILDRLDNGGAAARA